jgi:hypothetical protein
MHVQDVFYAIIIVHNDTNTKYSVIQFPAAAGTGSLVVSILDPVISTVLAAVVSKIVEAVGVSWSYPGQQNPQHPSPYPQPPSFTPFTLSTRSCASLVSASFTYTAPSSAQSSEWQSNTSVQQIHVFCNDCFRASCRRGDCVEGASRDFAGRRVGKQSGISNRNGFSPSSPFPPALLSLPSQVPHSWASESLEVEEPQPMPH